MSGPARVVRVEHTADVGLRGVAPDLESLFGVMARGLFEVVADPAAVVPRTERRVDVEAEGLPELLHEWLEELNQLHQIHGELYREFRVELDGVRLRGAARGEPIDFDRHELRTEVKAVTWHDLRLEETGDGYEAYVLLDI